MKPSSIFYMSLLAVLGCFLMVPATAAGQDFVYQPTNPAFGGSPLNYQWLLSSATVQNKYKEVRDFGFNEDPLANFQQQLKRQVLSELTRQIIEQKFGSFDITKTNSLKFGEFQIEVVPGSGGMTITIFDVTTGQETTITLPNI
ncbi:MAG TPA: curli assembly protein CsgF [Balneolaceae bacterium]